MGKVLTSTLKINMLGARGVARDAGMVASSLKKLQAISAMPMGKQFARNVGVMKRSAQQLSGVSTTFGLMGVLMARNGYLFDKALAQIAMTGEESEEKIAKLRQRIVEIAEDNPKMRREIARGALEFITAGNSIDRTIASLEDLTKGAVASMQDVGQTGADVTDVIAAMFGNIKDPDLFAQKVREVLNVMSVGASTANHKWAEQSLAMQYSVPVARALGIELEELTAMLGVLADNGFKGEKGGSALRTILLNLRAPTAAAKEAFKELGIEMNKAFSFNDKQAFSTDAVFEKLSSRFGTQDKALKPIIDGVLSQKNLQNDVGAMREALIARLSAAMNITPGELERKSALASAIDAHFQAATERFDPSYLFNKMNKMSVAQTKAITGVRRAPQALSLAKGFQGQYVPKLNNINEKKEGATMRRVEKYMNSFAGSVDQFTSKLDRLSDAIEQLVLVPVLKGITESLSSLVDAIKAADPAVVKFGFGALAALAVMAPLGFAISGVVASLRLISAAAGMAGLGVGMLGKALAGSFIASAMGARGALLGLRKAFLMLSMANIMGGPLAVMGTAMMGIKKGAIAALFSIRGLLAGVAMLGAVAWPVVLGATAIAAVIGYWDELKAFFTGFFKEIDNAFAAEGLGRPLETLGNAARLLGGYLKDAFGYVKSLLGFGGDGNHFGWMEAGERTAQLLAKAVNALIKPIKSAYQWLSKFFSFQGKAPAAAPGAKVEARARGGNVRAGRPYLVGERGPELITPSRAGFVVNNKALRNAARRGGGGTQVGNVTVNVAAPQGANAQQWGRDIGRAVRQEIQNRHSDGGYV